MTAHAVWLTGLSGSGKTTIAEGLADLVRSHDIDVEILDGRQVREDLGDFFGYSREERMKVNRVLCSIARHLTRHEVLTIVTAITPYQESRDFNRRELDQYLEIHVDCPFDVCVARDRSRLYEKALRNDIKHVIGVDDPYEIPRTSDFRLANGSLSVSESIREAAAFLSAAVGLGEAS